MTPGTVLAEQALTRLANRYCDAVSRRDWATLGKCFSEDAIWKVGRPMNFGAEGRAEIEALVADKVSKVDIVVQTLGSVVLLDSGPDWGRGRTTIQEHGKRDENTGISLIGMYDDEIVLAGGEWYFSRRELTVLTVDASSQDVTNYRDA
jgi:ketosteroid isomerase-like protein